MMRRCWHVRLTFPFRVSSLQVWLPVTSLLGHTDGWCRSLRVAWQLSYVRVRRVGVPRKRTIILTPTMAFVPRVLPSKIGYRHGRRGCDSCLVSGCGSLTFPSARSLYFPNAFWRVNL